MDGYFTGRPITIATTSCPVVSLIAFWPEFYLMYFSCIARQESDKSKSSVCILLNGRGRCQVGTSTS